MKGDWGDNGQVIWTGTELFRLPTVWESLGIQFGAAEHFLECCVVEGAVDGGVGKPLRRGWGLSHWGRGGRGQGVGEWATWLGGGGGVASRMEAWCWGRGGRGGRGASRGDRSCDSI